MLGHSFGGQLAIRYCSTYPNRVSKLILIANSGIKDNSPQAMLKRKIFRLLAKIGKKITKSNFFRFLLYKLTREGDYYSASPLLRRTMAKVINDQIISDLPKITIPTCIIWGKLDKTTPVKNAQLVHDQISHSRLEYIKQASHAPQFSHPQQTANIISSFLTRLVVK